MIKNFDGWNTKKKQIETESTAVFCHEREVWWCALGVNVGFEQDGSEDGHRRPVVVLKGFSAQTCLVIPLTTSNHDHPMRPSVGLVNRKEARAMLSQMRVIDTKRFVSKIGYISREAFDRIRKTAKELL